MHIIAETIHITRLNYSQAKNLVDSVHALFQNVEVHDFVKNNYFIFIKKVFEIYSKEVCITSQERSSQDVLHFSQDINFLYQILTFEKK